MTPEELIAYNFVQEMDLKDRAPILIKAIHKMLKEAELQAQRRGREIRDKQLENETICPACGCDFEEHKKLRQSAQDLK